MLFLTISLYASAANETTVHETKETDEQLYDKVKNSKFCERVDYNRDLLNLDNEPAMLNVELEAMLEFLEPYKGKVYSYDWHSADIYPSMTYIRQLHEALRERNTSIYKEHGDSYITCSDGQYNVMETIIHTICRAKARQEKCEVFFDRKDQEVTDDLEDLCDIFDDLYDNYTA